MFEDKYLWQLKQKIKYLIKLKNISWGPSVPKPRFSQGEINLQFRH